MVISEMDGRMGGLGQPDGDAARGVEAGLPALALRLCVGWDDGIAKKNRDKGITTTKRFARTQPQKKKKEFKPRRLQKRGKNKEKKVSKDGTDNKEG